MPGVRSTLTRRTGRTTVNLLVKYLEMSWPRVAISAISSAVGRLDVFGITLFFLRCRFPSHNQMVVFPFAVVPELENDRAQPTTAPSDSAELLRIVALPVDHISLVEDLLGLFEADLVLCYSYRKMKSLGIAARK
jgi:hypothetical protein